MARMRLKSRRGISIVEGTMMVPILTLLIFGALEFGSVLHVRHNMLIAAREGARTLAVQGGSVADAQAAALSVLPQNDYDWTVTATTPDDAVSDLDRDVSVSVSVPFSQAAAGNLMGFFEPGDMTVTVTMRSEE